MYDENRLTLGQKHWYVDNIPCNSFAQWISRAFRMILLINVRVPNDIVNFLGAENFLGARSSGSTGPDTCQLIA